MCFAVSEAAQRQISLTDKEAAWVGNKIFLNECSGNDDLLICWNKGEDFASLGIGHFIWYPQGKKGPFGESFPDLVKFIRKKGVYVPAWLEGPCPWQSRQELLRDIKGPKAAELKKFLARTKDIQVSFIIARLKQALPKILSAAPEGSRPQIEQRFYRLASTPYGLYALIDYVNFKGEGIAKTERYKGQGWGLLQVLERMQGEEDGIAASQEFVRAAKLILSERVDNSPSERNEARWLPGWKKRLDTYIP